ncbi:MAG: beta-ketoacyl-[acyl-carrier-protein] synthase family protein [Desulfobacteraceae bacterium]|nr:MAG: beta-ketoacyl-[acyl-carrier-protein] synthase family protein [Desulfobacteraceae bacterium]
METRVVVTGMGVVSPNAHGIESFHQALKHGQSGIRLIPALQELNFACCIAGVPKDFEEIGRRYFPENQISRMNGAIGYASVAALDAWKDAGLHLPSDESSADWETGAIVGCGIGDMELIATTIVPVVNSGKVRKLGSRIVEQVMGSGMSARIAGLLGLGNQVTSNSSACSTGTEAIVEAFWRIRSGLAKRMIAGGAEGASPYTWAGFDAMRVLSRKFNDRPQKGSRPMSASAAGFVPGAGAGVLVLEELETALNRKAGIYAEIIGGRVNCGGQRGGGSMTAPNPEGVRRCIADTIADADLSPDEIDAINGHLTATYADPHEIQNWSKALGRGPGCFPYINSTKSMIGHCLGAAGAIETIAALIQLSRGFLHPSLNCEDLHPEIEAFSDHVVQVGMSYPELKTMAKASFGFGDVNSCLILRKWDTQ